MINVIPPNPTLGYMNLTITILVIMGNDMDKKGLYQCAKLQDLGDCECCYVGKTKSNPTSQASHKIQGKIHFLLYT